MPARPNCACNTDYSGMPDNDRIGRVIKPAILAAAAYKVADAAGFVKLDAMENPYPWPAPLKAKWTDCLLKAELNRYPDANAEALSRGVRALLKLPDNIDLLFGNGSDELIQLILLALSRENNVVMAPEPTFVMYRHTSALLEQEFVGIPLNPDFSLNLAAMLDAISARQPAVIFIARPNNPSGNAFAEPAIRAIIEVAPGLVVIDEAYHIFAGETLLPLLQQHRHVLLMRTLSKLGLAGLRLGLLLGRREWLSELNKLRLPYNIGTLNQLSAGFMLDNNSLLEQQAETICKDRAALYAALGELEGIEVWPSQANFILFRAHTRPATEVHRALLDRRILIKKLHGAHPLLQNCLRVTVGTKQENRRFLTALKAIMTA